MSFSDVIKIMQGETVYTVSQYIIVIHRTRSVRIGNNSARGLNYGLGPYSKEHTDRPRPVNNIFISKESLSILFLLFLLQKNKAYVLQPIHNECSPPMIAGKIEKLRPLAEPITMHALQNSARARTEKK